MQLKELEQNVSNVENIINSLESVEDLEQLLWNIEHPDLDFPEVGLVEFVLSDKYLDCKDEIYDSCLNDLKSMEKGGQKRIILEGAPGCGKSFVSSCLISYTLARTLSLRSPQKTFGMARGTFICAMNMGVNEINARNVIFNDVKARIDNSPWFQKFFPPDPEIKSALRFSKNVGLIPGNSKMTFPLGFNVFCAVMDDCAWYQDTDEKDIAKEMYEQLDKRISRRYPTCPWAYLIMVSNPSYNNKFIEKMQERAFAEPNKYWAMRRKIWDAKPFMYCGKTFEYNGRQIPIEHKDDYEKDPVSAERDLEAKPSASLMPFFKSMIPVYQSLNKAVKNPVEGKDFNRISESFKPIDVNYFIHLDLAVNKCSAALAMSRWLSTNKIRVELIMRFDPKQLGGEINFEDIREYIYLLKDMKFNIRRLTADGFNCLGGNTEIPLLNGNVKKIKDIKAGDYVYSLNNNQEIVAGRVKSDAKMTGMKRIIRITLDNGQVIDCSEEHPFLMRDNIYKRANDLNIDDSLMPLYKKTGKTNEYFKERFNSLS